MIPGPPELFKCPSCDEILCRGSIMSGNTFGSRLFSDGKTISPMLPDFPQIAECLGCDEILWLEGNEVNEADLVYPDKIYVQRAKFLNAFKLNAAIHRGMAKNLAQEIYIRRYIVWAINDRVRSNEKIFPDDNFKNIWDENQSFLIDLLNENNIDHRFLLIEMYRNRGDFYKAYNLLMPVYTRKYMGIKEAFKFHIENKNQKLFEIII